MASPFHLHAAESKGASGGLIFESRAPGESGGGIAISINPNGHSFRLLQRTHVDAIGARVSGSAGQTVYAAIHHIGTPETVPDVVNETTLLGTTLLTLPGATATTVTGPIDLVLEPGWYAILIGNGRHGANATGLPSTVSTGTPTTPQSRGPYSVNATTNARTLQGVTTRYVVFGTTLPPEPVPSSRFLFETASPAAWWSSGFSTLSTTNLRGTRFSLDAPTRVGRVASWLANGNGTLFAAILPISGPSGLPPSANSPQFETSAVASTVFAPGGPVDEYSGDFGGVLLPPGHYALVFGSGRFGASGTAWIAGVADQIIVPGALFFDGSQSSSWFNVTSLNYRMVLEGVLPELEVVPDPVEFGATAVGATLASTLTVRNLRDGDLQLVDIVIVDDPEGQFALGANAADCADALLEVDVECSFSVEFTPSLLGESSATLRVLSDGAPSPYDVIMSGTGLSGFTVTPLAGTGGSIAPDTPQIIATGETADFTLTSDEGYNIASVDGDCGGTLAGNVFTTAPITAHCQVVANFVADIPVAIEGVGGDAQSTTVLATFSDPLEVRVLNIEGAPLQGIDVAFDADITPGAPGATVPATVTTAAGGIAAASATANAVAGTHQVVASVPGVVGTVVFDLTNLAGPPADISVIEGDGQSAVVGTLFQMPLTARVVDSEGNPVPEVAVDFEPPAVGASAILSEPFALTDGDGIVQVTARANGDTGSYAVSATVAGVVDSAEFALTNTEQLIELGISIDNGVMTAEYGDVLDYLVTVSNSGSADATQVSVVALLPAALDVDNASWVCLDLASGCTSAGSGALADENFEVAVGTSVRWLLSAAVRSDASDDIVIVEAISTSPDQAAMPTDEDITRLRLFADGFEVPVDR